MRLDEEVGYVREILPGDAEWVGRLEVAGREHQVTARNGLWLRAPGVLRHELEPVSRPRHAPHRVILAHIQLEMLPHLPIGAQGLASRGLAARSDETHPHLALVGRRA